MTDVEFERRKAICEAANVNDIGEVSDGFHTFDSLYEQRMILFAALVKAYRSKAWKSYRHEDGEYCFGGGWFIVGIDTPEGSYTYHYKNKYWNMFDCVDLPRAPHWDGHTEADAETRLMSLEPEIKTDDDTISRQAAIRWVKAECNPYGKPTLDYESGKRVMKHLEQMPSVQPERDQGHWIGIDDEPCETWECDKCGYIQECFDGEQPNFCSNCGADMRGEENG